MKSSVRKDAVLELMMAAALWGYGFIAAIYALKAMGPLSVTGWRFVIAFLLGSLIITLTPSLRKDADWGQFKLSLVPGILISMTLVLQTWGLIYTTATKSGFITVLYALFVPFLEKSLLKRGLPRFHLVWVLIALFGIALMCDIASAFKAQDLSDGAEKALLIWNVGDFLTLLCAAAASLHILYFGVIHRKIQSSFVFNNFQSFWAGLFPLVLAFFLEPLPNISFSDGSLFGLLMLGIGSSLIAFAMQVEAQKHLSPSLASLLFLLESPFAALFAIYILGENLDTAQWVGAGLILASAGLSSVFSSEAKDQKDLQELAVESEKLS